MATVDLLPDSAAQGALTKAVLGQQGLIEEAGYEEQAKSYALMAQASRMSADAEDKAATGLDHHVNRQGRGRRGVAVSESEPRITLAPVSRPACRLALQRRRPWSLCSRKRTH
jgi:hypothetical protein